MRFSEFPENANLKMLFRGELLLQPIIMAPWSDPLRILSDSISVLYVQPYIKIFLFFLNLRILRICEIINEVNIQNF